MSNERMRDGDEVVLYQKGDGYLARRKVAQFEDGTLKLEEQDGSGMGTWHRDPDTGVALDETEARKLYEMLKERFGRQRAR